MKLIVSLGILWLVIMAIVWAVITVVDAHADDDCIAVGPDGRLLCWATVTATATPTTAPTETPIPPTPTQTPTPTLPIPANGHITVPGTYSGTRDCPTIHDTGYCMWISASNVTLQDFAITSRGRGIGMSFTSNITIRNGTFSTRGAGIAIWDNTTDVLIDNVSINIVPSTLQRISFLPIRDSASGCEPLTTKRVRDIEIANSDFHGGDLNYGWFGLEAKCVQNLHIHDNFFEGGHVLVSLPDNLDVLIEDNTFDMRGSPFWGVEVAKAHNVTVQGNTFLGDGSNGGDHAVSQNSDPRNTIVRDNTITNIRTVLDTWGSYITVTNNQCQGVLRLLEYELSPPYVQRVISGNSGCGVTPPSTGSGGLR